MGCGVRLRGGEGTALTRVLVVLRHVYLKLFEALQWKRVAALTEDGQKYSEYISHLQDLLHLHGITLTNRKFPREREKDAMTNVSYSVLLRDL